MITILVGTNRPQNQSQKVATYLKDCFAQKGAEAKVVQPSDFLSEAVTIPDWQPDHQSNTAWSEVVESSQVFVMVIPEYNHSYPGEWKILLDSLFKQYEGKSVYLVGVSKGTFGGARVIEHVLPVLHAFAMDIKKEKLLVSNVSEVLDESKDPDFVRRVDQFVEHIINS